MRCKHIFATVVGLCILVASFLSVLDIVSFDRQFYEQEYQKYNNAEVIGISDEELLEVTDRLLGYIQSTYHDLEVSATIHGEVREVFNQKEIDHMVDVRILYTNAMHVRNACLIVAVLIAIVLFIIHKDKAIYLLVRGYIQAFGLFFALFLAIALFAWIDFNAFWIQFHELVFTNDLWLLNPNTDILIMMVPEGFFYDLVFKIAFSFVGFSVFFLAVSYFVKLKLESKRRMKI